MMDLFKDSKDAFEKVYAQEVCKRFYRYKDFWDEFIGQRIINGGFNHYELGFPDDYPEDKKKKILGLYEKICMYHYGVFCDLAGIRIQIQNYGDLSKKLSADERYCRYWEMVDSIYMHLGNIFYKYSGLWTVIMRLVEKPYFSKWTARDKEGVERYPEVKNRPDLFQELANLECEIKAKRDYISHFSRIASRVEDGRYLLPPIVKIREGFKSWSELQSEDKSDWVPADESIQQDLGRIENFLNSMHIFLIEELRAYLIKESISIKYPSVSTEQIASQKGHVGVSGTTVLGSATLGNGSPISSGAGFKRPIRNKPKGSGDSLDSNG